MSQVATHSRLPGEDELARRAGTPFASPRVMQPRPGNGSRTRPPFPYEQGDAHGRFFLGPNTAPPSRAAADRHGPPLPRRPRGGGRHGGTLTPYLGNYPPRAPQAR